MKNSIKVTLLSTLFCSIVILPYFVKTLLDTIHQNVPLNKGIIVLIGQILLAILYFVVMHLIYNKRERNEEQ